MVTTLRAARQVVTRRAWARAPIALTRHGTVRSLFGERGVSASDVHAAIVRESGVGDDLVLGGAARTVTDAVLERA